MSLLLRVPAYNDEPLKKEGVVAKGKVYPACLPTRAHRDKRGILAGWSDPLDIGIFYPEHSPGGSILSQENINEYREKNFIMKHVEIQVEKCTDPQWMGSETFYPKGNNTTTTLS